MKFPEQMPENSQLESPDGPDSIATRLIRDFESYVGTSVPGRLYSLEEISTRLDELYIDYETDRRDRSDMGISTG